MIFREQRKAIWNIKDVFFLVKLLKVISFLCPKKAARCMAEKGYRNDSRKGIDFYRIAKLANLRFHQVSSGTQSISFDSTLHIMTILLQIYLSCTLCSNLLIFIFFRYPFVMCYERCTHSSGEREKDEPKNITRN